MCPSTTREPFGQQASLRARTVIWLPLEEDRRIARVTRTPEAVLPQLVRARDISPGDLAEILASLGEPYDMLVAGPGQEFDLPKGSSIETLFGRLEAAGRIAIVQKLMCRGRKVRNLVYALVGEARAWQ
jgi:hypothetical protein